MERLHLDQIDRLILAALTENARIPLVALAAQVHLSRNAVKQRIERMERQGMIGATRSSPDAPADPRCQPS